MSGFEQTYLLRPDQGQKAELIGKLRKRFYFTRAVTYLVTSKETIALPQLADRC